jgi:hypothetical protein
LGRDARRSRDIFNDIVGDMFNVDHVIVYVTRPYGRGGVEGGGKLRRWSAKNCDAEFISDLL